MGKVDDYRLALEKLDDWMPYLAVNSGLPGPRGNLELRRRVRRRSRCGPGPAPDHEW